MTTAGIEPWLIAGGTAVGAALLLRQQNTTTPSPSSVTLTPLPSASLPTLTMRHVTLLPQQATNQDTDSNLDAAIREAKNRIRDEYNRTTGAARKAGADALNKEFGTNLKGDESFDDVLAIVSAAAGATAGAAGCTAVGAGALAKYCAALGGIAGAYLGKKLSQFISEAYSDVKSWVSDVYDSVSDKLTNSVKKAWGWLSNVF